MLEGLDKINWQGIKDSAGHSSEEIPILLQQLTSSNTALRRRAINDLGLRINLDYYVSAATIQVIPFLIDLLKTESIEDKHLILSELGEMISPTSELSSKEAHNASAEGLPALGNLEIAKGLFTYLRFLHHEEAQVRLRAVRLFQSYPIFADEYGPSIMQEICERCKQETDPKIKREAIYALRAVFRNYEIALSDKVEECKAFIKELES